MSLNESLITMKQRKDYISRRFRSLAATCMAHIASEKMTFYIGGDLNRGLNHEAIWYFAYGYFIAERKNNWLSNNPIDFADYINNLFHNPGITKGL
jgi:hypothetical protein